MIILDLNQVVYSTLLHQIMGTKDVTVDEGLLRHMILNCIRFHNFNNRSEYGEMVIACDNRKYWRKEFFPYYKAHRKQARDSLGLDWPTIFKSLDSIREELKVYMPYRVIDVDGAEADDVIATLAKNYHNEQKILIISGDKDFLQLQRYPNVKQYDPIRKKVLTVDDPKQFLFEHILTGDKGDGIPNIKSSDNSIVLGVRQTPVTKKFISCFKLKEDDSLLTRNFKRNETLIDLTKVPEYIQNKIVESFESQTNDRSKLFNYFSEYKLKNLMSSINEF